VVGRLLHLLVKDSKISNKFVLKKPLEEPSLKVMVMELMTTTKKRMTNQSNAIPTVKTAGTHFLTQAQTLYLHIQAQIPALLIKQI
jgi:hypothetical protein